jgi:signal transduction histidine kinase
VPSRSNKSRDAASGSADQYRANAELAEYGQSTSGAVGVPVTGAVAGPVDDAAGGLSVRQPGRPEDRQRGRRTGRLLRNWRVRSRLVLLIAIPTATAVGLGGASIVTSWRSAVADQRTEVLASLTTQITQLGFWVEAERDAIVSYIAAPGFSGRAGYLSGHKSSAQDQLQVAKEQILFTKPYESAVAAGISQVGSGYSATVQAHASAVAASLTSLNGLRSQALYTKIPAYQVITEYDNHVINVLLTFEDQVALSSSDPQLTSTARAVANISRAENELSTQRAIVMYGLVHQRLDTNLLGELQASVANEGSDLTAFQAFATPAQSSYYQAQLAASGLQDRVNYDKSSVLANPGSVGTLPIVPQDWYGAASAVIGSVHNVEEYLASSAVSRAKALRERAIITAIIVGAVILLVLVLSLLFTVFVGRSMVRPLRRLRAGALEVAGIRLPETVRRMSETDGESVPVEIEPIDVESADEIGEVARAFDQVHREALRLAATEAALRGNVNAMFVNLSRRSQSLVERQIRLIDELEQGEQDPERLGSLFQMDHLATRMRRNSENLLVLAGHESSRRWNQPVPLVDVLRAAISEIEQYERVMLNVQPGISVRGPAVNDVVHLIAELAENATSFSSADTPVTVSGHLLGSGGVLLDITDEGVGMGGDEMAHANWRLDNPPVVDVAVSRRMGLFVVARLAARHGIRVRLRPASGNGLTALVWLPDEVIVHDGTSGATEPGRLADRPSRVALEPGAMGAPGSGGGWIQPGPGPSAYDEVAAARSRFSPAADSNGDYGLAGVGQPGLGSRPGADSSPGFGAADLGRPDWQSGSGQFAEPPFGERPSGDRLLTGPGFGESAFGDREFASAQFGGSDAATANRPLTDSGDPELGPHRIPGAGPHPGQVSTGPIPAIDTGPRRAVDQPDWFTAAGREARLDIGQGQTDWPAEPTAGAEGAPRQPDQAFAPAADWQPQSPGWADDQSSRERLAWSDGTTDQRAQLDFGASPARSAPLSGTFRTQETKFGTTAGGVIVPPPASLGEENRLPIFEAVESDWFRRGRPTVDWPGGQDDRASGLGWSSPSDEGWRAAEVAVAPASGGTTVAGLPRRVPQANLIPGTAAEAPAPVPVARSAAATRERFASLQRGIREGRAASGIDSTEGSGEVPGDG